MEFYGATEGNVGMINYDGKVGAIGRVPWYARTVQPIRLVRYDVEKQEPIREADGFCRETADGEVGRSRAADGWSSYRIEKHTRLNRLNRARTTTGTRPQWPTLPSVGI